MLTSSTLHVDIVYMFLLKRLWHQSPSLTATTFLMLAALLASIAGMLLDPRTITGVSAWLKPAKFAISTAIFSSTTAWIFGYLTITPRVKCLGDTLAAVVILEVAIIDLQAFRGTTSHFNVATPADSILFGIMGAAIAVLWVASIGITVALFRQRFSDPAWGWALRLGMLITVIGSATGGLMLRTTPEQSAQHQLHQNLNANGGHTVGAPDGEPGLPGLGWSTDHGDLRIPHFFGLHGLQALPFLAWLFQRRRRPTALVATIATSYLGLIVILTCQALAGQALFHPSPAILSAFAIWASATLAAILLTQIRTASPERIQAGATL